MSPGDVTIAAPHVSVMPNVMLSFAPKNASTRRTNDGSTVDPPVMTTSTASVSTSAKPGCSSIACRSVGAAETIPGRCSAIAASVRSAVNASTTCGAHAQAAPSVPSTLPAVWKSGIGLIHAAPSETSSRSANASAVSTIARWVMSTPFGCPVVPDVYWTWPSASGSTAGSAVSVAPSRSAAHPSPGTIVSRSSGSSGASAATDSARRCPRCSSATRIPAAPDWRRT